MISSLNAASDHFGNLILTAIAVFTYVAIAVASTSQEDLLVGKRLSLPLLETPIPLRSFYLVAPFLVILLHIYVLLYGRLVFEKVAELGDVEYHSSQLQWQGFVVLMMREGILGWLGRLFFYVIGAITPLAVLLVLELRFLAFREPCVTFLHCALVVVDAVVVGLIGRWKVLRPGSAEVRFPWRRLPIALGLGTALLSASVATTVLHKPKFLTNLAQVDLPEAIILKDQPDGPKLNEFGDLADALLRYGTGADLRSRNLSYANLKHAILVNADLRGATFRGADLSYADIRRARLTDADFREAILVGTRFDGSVGENVRFEGANLQQAHLTGVRLTRARFRDADMAEAEMHWSTFKDGDFDLANLYKASIMGATFDGTSLVGTHFLNATARKTLFRRTNLVLARFNGARLQGSHFYLVSGESNGAVFDAAEMHFVEATNLNGVCLRGVTIYDKGTHLGFLRLADSRRIAKEDSRAEAKDRWREEVLEKRKAVQKTVDPRKGDWFKDEWKKHDDALRESSEPSCFLCQITQMDNRLGCEGCILAYDDSVKGLGGLMEKEQAATIELVQREILGEVIAQARRSSSDVIRIGLMRELVKCFSPPRDPDWSEYERWLDKDGLAELKQFLGGEGEALGQRDICPWWLRGGDSHRAQDEEE